MIKFASRISRHGLLDFAMHATLYLRLVVMTSVFRGKVN